MVYVQQLISALVSNNAADIYSEWLVGTTYTTVGDIVRVGNYTYKSTVVDNLGNNPLETSSVYWIKWEPANDYALLDLLEDTKTVWAANGIVVFTRGSKDTLGIGNFKATQITIEYLTDVGAVLDTETHNFSNNSNVWDEWDYGYAGFTDSVSKTVYVPLQRIGQDVRVTFLASGSDTYCGFFVAGIAVDMGKTYTGIKFPDKRIGSRTYSSANFITFVERNTLMRKLALAKALVNETMLFVIDESETSLYENMVILGKITKVEGVATNVSVNDISWTVEQTILE